MSAVAKDDPHELINDPQVVLGIRDLALASDAAASLEKHQGIDYCCVNLPESSADTRDDVLKLPASWWRTSVVGVLGSLKDWKMPMEWAWHMNLPVVILPALGSMALHRLEYAQQLASIAKMALTGAADQSFQMWVPVEVQQVTEWLKVLQDAGFPPNVGVILRMDSITAGSMSPEESMSHMLLLLHQWVGCGPIWGVQLPAFLANKQGYPTMAKMHQHSLEFLWTRVGASIKLLMFSKEDESADQVALKKKYVEHVRGRTNVRAALDTRYAQLERPYLDVAQKPLQPLRDHLPYETYEVFEKDPVKYAQYEEAIRQACQEHPIRHIWVVGAGRGPLVRAALQASSSRAAEIHITGLEKNPSACVYLRSMFAGEGRVTIVEQDLRDVPAEQAKGIDLIVSELLGSFGCNELSPECLDMLMAKCRNDCISIPANYTSYVAPLSSLSIHHTMDGSRELPCVVRTHAAAQLCKEQACWAFLHPTKSIDRERATKLSFTTCTSESGNGYGPMSKRTTPDPALNSAVLVTGLVATFHATLYGNVAISTVPESFSFGMFSWFPLVFPLKQPFLWTPSKEALDVFLWRSCDDRKVWYEWNLSTERHSSGIHNVLGKASSVAL